MFENYETIIFFDTETTGLDAETCRVIELAAIQYRKINGEWVKANNMDALIRLPEGNRIPEKIVQLTHITDELLEKEGCNAKEVCELFSTYFYFGKTLLIAHNAQFDLNFLTYMFLRNLPSNVRFITEADYLDTLTVARDRKAYPHRLENMIEHYGLSGECQNSHRAIDDTYALKLVTDKMAEERADLDEYINVFGYSRKYGLSGKELKKVRYIPQPYRNYMAGVEDILPRCC